MAREANVYLFARHRAGEPADVLRLDPQRVQALRLRVGPRYGVRGLVGYDAPPAGAHHGRARPGDGLAAPGGRW